MSHVYAGDPFHRDAVAARQAIAEGLSALRQSVDGMIVNAIRGDSPKRTRNRAPVNESPGLRMPPSGNVKPIGNGGRVPPRPPMQPTAGQRSNLGETPLPGEVTVVVPAQSTSGPPVRRRSRRSSRPARPERRGGRGLGAGRAGPGGRVRRRSD